MKNSRVQNLQREKFNAILICSHLKGIRCYYTIDTDSVLIMSCNGYGRQRISNVFE